MKSISTDGIPGYKMPRRRKDMQGKGIKDVLKKVNKYLKDSKIISKTAGVMGALGTPYAGAISSGAKMAGYGKGRTPRKLASG